MEEKMLNDKATIKSGNRRWERSAFQATEKQLVQSANTLMFMQNGASSIYVLWVPIF